ncbi:hypothetical protein [Streptosporangium longisporum]|uniref:Uncharacterized protein n=1 Tax=Streptosporangium longisporum TaxID=46187 RepID=A0ABP6LCL8_9ACTN
MATQLRRVTLWGGPMDGEAFLVTADWDGMYLPVPGEERRAIYEPDTDGDPDRWLHRGWIA